jgi:hypothetical protein
VIVLPFGSPTVDFNSKKAPQRLQEPTHNVNSALCGMKPSINSPYLKCPTWEKEGNWYKKPVSGQIKE